jgi:hypothetical protein
MVLSHQLEKKKIKENINVDNKRDTINIKILFVFSNSLLDSQIKRKQTFQV